MAYSLADSELVNSNPLIRCVHFLRQMQTRL